MKFVGIALHAQTITLAVVDAARKRLLHAVHQFAERGHHVTLLRRLGPFQLTDATILAEMLALDQIPPAYRPTPRQREQQVLQRCKTDRMLAEFAQAGSEQERADRAILLTIPGVGIVASDVYPG